MPKTALELLENWTGIGNRGRTTDGKNNRWVEDYTSMFLMDFGERKK